jgi:hypothetical protein
MEHSPSVMVPTQTSPVNRSSAAFAVDATGNRISTASLRHRSWTTRRNVVAALIPHGHPA